MAHSGAFALNLHNIVNISVQYNLSYLFYKPTIFMLKVTSQCNKLRLVLKNEEGFKSRVQELNLPGANYEFAASTARPTLDVP